MERLPNPPLVPSSMSSGGETHTNALAQSAPGSTPVTPMPDPSLTLMELGVNQGLPAEGAPDAVIPGIGRDGSGRFTSAEPHQGGAWSQPGGFAEGGSDGAGWRQT